jgi:hypothetical protein
VTVSEVRVCRSWFGEAGLERCPGRSPRPASPSHGLTADLETEIVCDVAGRIFGRYPHVIHDQFPAGSAGVRIPDCLARGAQASGETLGSLTDDRSVVADVVPATNRPSTRSSPMSAW